MMVFGILAAIASATRVAEADNNCPLVESRPAFVEGCKPPFPRYPAAAIKRHAHGTVLVEVTIPAGGGAPLGARVVSTGDEPLLAESALKSVEHACWGPLNREGSPSCYRFVDSVKFYLKQ